MHMHIPGVVHLELIVPAVDDVLDTIHSERRLCDVSRHNALSCPLLSALKDLKRKEEKKRKKKWERRAREGVRDAL